MCVKDQSMIKMLIKVSIVIIIIDNIYLSITLYDGRASE